MELNSPGPVSVSIELRDLAGNACNEAEVDPEVDVVENMYIEEKEDDDGVGVVESVHVGSVRSPGCGTREPRYSTARPSNWIPPLPPIVMIPAS